jgi:hypothetical protein
MQQKYLLKCLACSTFLAIAKITMAIIKIRTAIVIIRIIMFKSQFIRVMNFGK